MRLWSIHPSYLDSKGLVALWREGLLAQSVLLGKTKGYKNHPQLLRFKNTNNPTGAIARYLRQVNDEARKRGYKFERTKIINNKCASKIAVTIGQLEYEFRHLLDKVEKRDKKLHEQLKTQQTIVPHPLFVQVAGEAEEWERIS